MKNKKIIISSVLLLFILLFTIITCKVYQHDKYIHDNFSAMNNGRELEVIVAKNENNNKILLTKGDDKNKTIIVGNNFDIKQLNNELFKDKILKKQYFLEDKYISYAYTNKIQPGGYIFYGNNNFEQNFNNLIKGPIQNDFKKHYFNSIKNDAIKLGKQYNILPSIIMAHSAIESQFGCSELAYKYNNYFGIKAQKGAPSVVLPTKEFVNGKYITVKSRFYSPKNIYESLESYCKTLNKGNEWNKKQFKDVVGEKNYKKAAKGLVKDGYATDPNLSNNIIGIIKEFNLNKYDND